MKKTAIIVLITAAFCQASHAQKHRMGLIFDDQSYAASPRKVGQEKMLELPERVSYEKYMPTVIDQGDFGTCVSMSTAYYFRTMVDAIQRKTTNQATIDQWRYSPSYLYNRIKESNDLNCQNGTSIFLAFSLLKDEGIATLLQMGYPNCQNNSDLTVAGSSKISDMTIIFALNASSKAKVVAAQKALADGYPIAVGMHSPPSFMSLAQQEVWTPTAEEKTNLCDNCGHAICIIGYDDTKFGGAFRVLNSWGTAWGQNGLCWMRYDDFGRFVKYGFEGFPLPDPNPAPTQTMLSGEANFQLLGGGTVAVQRNIVAKGTNTDNDPSTTDQIAAYELSNAYNSGTRFKFGVTVKKQAHVYVIGSDLDDNTKTLFPFDASVSAAFAANTQMTLPSANKNYQLDTNKGTDYWLFLYAENPLNITEITQKLKAASGSFSDKVMSVLGKELVEPAHINYFKDRVGFDLQGNPKGSIVPLLVSLKHN